MIESAIDSNIRPAEQARPRRLASNAYWVGAGVMLGAAILFVAGAYFGGVVLHPGRSSVAVSQATSLDNPAAEARLRALEAALAERSLQWEAAQQRLGEQGRRPSAPPAAVAGQGERFLVALIYLQGAIASSRPWQRELQIVMNLAAPGQIPRPLAETLASHAARGLPTEAELRERFTALTPVMIERAPSEGDIFTRLLGFARSVLAGIGLASAPAPSAMEAALASIAERLRRRDLAGALVDIMALDESVQPLIAGWVAQARARLAVEQAIQESLLPALTGGRSIALAPG